MSYENLITKSLNIKPSDLLSVMSSSKKMALSYLRYDLNLWNVVAIFVTFQEKLMDIIKEN